MAQYTISFENVKLDFDDPEIAYSNAKAAMRKFQSVTITGPKRKMSFEELAALDAAAKEARRKEFFERRCEK